MKRLFLSIFILSIFWITIGCAGSKVSELEYDLQNLQVDMVDVKKQVNDLVQKMTQLLQRMETEVYPIVKSQSEYFLKIDKLESDLRINNDKLDQTSYKLSQMQQQMDDIKYRMRSSGTPDYSVPTAPTGSYSQPTTRQFDTLSPNQLYQTAYADYLKGNYKLAINGFTEYLTRYSDSELAPSVQYWLGECHYAKGDYEQAIKEFDKVIINYPKDEKVKSAALKKGFALFELNQTAQGVIIMQQIIREFPNSKQARIAKEKLESLGLKP